MPKKQQKMASNQKMQENKPTLKFYIGIHVTKFEKIILLNSTCPIEECVYLRDVLDSKFRVKLVVDFKARLVSPSF